MGCRTAKRTPRWPTRLCQPVAPARPRQTILATEAESSSSIEPPPRLNQSRVVRFMNARPTVFGYCTNIHAGLDRASIEANLRQHSGVVRRQLGWDQLGIGLWIPQRAAHEIATDTKSFAKLLGELGLNPYTMNGFPFDNFHGDRVKHAVYQPAWWERARVDYTVQLAEILAAILPDETQVGSISTLPLGWPSGDPATDQLRIEKSGEHLREVAKCLRKIRRRTGKRITLAIEPEPGCLLDHSHDAVQFFQQHLVGDTEREHLSICHDVCHAAVMMESQSDVLDAYRRAEIEVGKVQVSSGIAVHWDAMASARQHEALEQIRGFAEDRYLHQTGRRVADGSFALVEDLPDLLPKRVAANEPATGDQLWTIHFHVPIFLDRIGNLSTTQSDIDEAFHVMHGDEAPSFTGHFEVETYAWTVLPESMRRGSVNDEIEKEMRWAINRWERWTGATKID